VRAACRFVTLAMSLFWTAQLSLGGEHDWYECPVGQTKHLDLNKISLIRDSVVRPNLHTLQFYSFGSHFLLSVSAAGFSNDMLSQLKALLLQSSKVKLGASCHPGSYNVRKTLIMSSAALLALAVGTFQC
jgi:hypothetical protein